MSTKESLREEFRFITTTFQHRRCRKMCKRSFKFRERFVDALRKQHIELKDPQLSVQLILCVALLFVDC